MLTFLASSTLAACGGSGDTTSDLPEEINIGYLRVPNDEKIAKTEALFDEYFADKGIETNFLVFDSGVEANQAFASGSIDFASMGNTNGIIALSRGLDVELIWLHEILGEIEALAVRKDSGIEKVEDLAGKSIATTFASTSHYSLLQVLNEAGIADQVQLLDMQTVDIVAAWERGDIDAAYTWQPSLGSLLKTVTCWFPLNRLLRWATRRRMCCWQEKDSRNSILSSRRISLRRLSQAAIFTGKIRNRQPQLLRYRLE